MQFHYQVDLTKYKPPKSNINLKIKKSRTFINNDFDFIEFIKEKLRLNHARSDIASIIVYSYFF